MSIAHHPAASTLVEFAAGSLGQAARAVVATHLELCRRCRDDVSIAEAVGGALLDALPPSEMVPDALLRALAALASPAVEDERAVVPPLLPGGVAVPVPLRPYVSDRWRWLAPGIRLMPLLPVNPSGMRLDMIHVAPGTALPRHGHRGRELACVITGSFSDATGVFGPGDLAEVDATREHQPAASADGACICVIATEGRLRMSGLLARLLQPLIDI